MSRAHFVRSATDIDGVPLRTCTVSIYTAGTRQLLVDPLYQGSAGSVVLPNPFSITNGIVEFFLDQPRTVSVGLESVDSHSVIDYLDVFPPTETMVTATNGLRILNEPSEGQFLQATSLSTAQWTEANEITSTKATPLQVLADFAFNPDTGGFTTPDAQSSMQITDINGETVVPTYVPAPSDVPDGFHVSQALQVPTTSVISIHLGPLTFPESGWLEVCFFVVGSDAVSAAGLQIIIDTNYPSVRLPQTTDLLGTWRVGYLGGIEPGTHSARLVQLPGIDPDSHVLLGEIRAYYGMNIPFHTHNGAGANSLMLGPHASATPDDTTAVGGSAVAADQGGTALGAHSSAELEGTALGAYSVAGRYGTAVGYKAMNTLGSEGGLAAGYGARTQATDAIAVGRNAISSGAFAVALGAGASASNYQGIALGAGAQALAANAEAIGAGANVAEDHIGSIALGVNAATSAANQCVLGTSDTTVSISGDLVLHGSAILGGASGILGFYGTPGVPKPAVTGSRGGNTALATVLTALAELGLIVDSTGA